MIPKHSQTCATTITEHEAQRVERANATGRQPVVFAAGRIAQRCSHIEAYLAGVGKELRDVFSRGDAEWADWRADRTGIACAKRDSDESQISMCCAAQGY